jgi:ribosomal protein L30/L7E
MKASPIIEGANYLRVKLDRSLIGLPKKFKEHSKGLGLSRLHQKSYVKVNPFTIGNIIKMKELISVKGVKGKPIKGTKYWSQGFELINSYLK